MRTTCRMVPVVWLAYDPSIRSNLPHGEHPLDAAEHGQLSIAADHSNRNPRHVLLFWFPPCALFLASVYSHTIR